MFSLCFGLFCIRGQFPKGASYYRRCFSILNLVGLYLEGLIFGGAYIWKVLFSEFYSIYKGLGQNIWHKF